MKRIRVVCAIICRSEKYLLTRRGPGMSLPGKWEFPGGKVDEGESVQAALKRELREELGIDAAVGNIVAMNTHCSSEHELELLALSVESFTGDIILHEHDQLAWVSGDELLRHDLAAADVPIAKTLQRA